MDKYITTDKRYITYDDVYPMMIEQGLKKREARKQTIAYINDWNKSAYEELKEITNSLKESIDHFEGLRKDYRSDKNLPLIVSYLSKMLKKY
jgi:ribosomal protein S15P/S13E